MVRSSCHPSEDEYYYDNREIGEDFAILSNDFPKENGRNGGVVEDDNARARREHSEFLASLDDKQKNAVKVLDSWFQLKASVSAQMSEFQAENEKMRTAVDRSRCGRSNQVLGKAYESPGSNNSVEGELSFAKKLTIGAEYLETKAQEREGVLKKIEALEGEVRGLRIELDHERARSKSIQESCNAKLKARKKEAEGMRAALRRSKKENEALRSEMKAIKQIEEERSVSGAETQEKETPSPSSSREALRRINSDTSSAFQPYDKKILHSRSIAETEMDLLSRKKIRTQGYEDEALCTPRHEEYDAQHSPRSQGYSALLSPREETRDDDGLTEDRGKADSRGTEEDERVEAEDLREEEDQPDFVNELKSEIPMDKTCKEQAEQPGDDVAEEHEYIAEESSNEHLSTSDLLETKHPDTTDAPTVEPKYNAAGAGEPTITNKLIHDNGLSNGLAEDTRNTVEATLSSDSNGLRREEDFRPKRGKIAEALQNLEKNSGSPFILRAPSPAPIRVASPATISGESHATGRAASSAAIRGAKNVAFRTQSPFLSKSYSDANEDETPTKGTWTKKTLAEQNTPTFKTPNTVTVASSFESAKSHFAQQSPRKFHLSQQSSLPPSHRCERAAPVPLEQNQSQTHQTNTPKPIKQTELECDTPANLSAQHRTVRPNGSSLQRQVENPRGCESSENCPPSSAIENIQKATSELHLEEPPKGASAGVGAGASSTRKELEELRSLLKGKGKEKKEKFETFGKEREDEKNKYSFQPSWVKNN